MIKPYLLIALIIGAAPLAALADPMSVAGDGNLLAATSVAPSASAGGSAVMADPADDETAREPLTTREATGPRGTRQQSDTARAPEQVRAPARSPAHKKAETARWQSLLPGVMK